MDIELSLLLLLLLLFVFVRFSQGLKEAVHNCQDAVQVSNKDGSIMVWLYNSNTHSSNGQSPPIYCLY